MALPKGAKSSGTGPGKGAAMGGSFLDLPKDVVKPPPSRPAPAVWTNPPVNKLRQPPPPKPVGPPPPPPPAAAAAAAAGGGFTVGAVAAALVAAIALVLFFDSPAAAPTLMFPPEPPKEVESPNFPFQGGQTSGILYIINYIFHEKVGYDDKDYPQSKTVEVFGPIGGSYRDQRNSSAYDLGFIARGDTSTGFKLIPTKLNIHSSPASLNGALPYLQITKINRKDAQPDTGGNPPPLNNPTSSAPGNSLGAPSPAPPSTAPSPSPKAPGTSPEPKRYPGPAPTPKGDPAPEPKRYPGPIPAPSPDPGGTPQPEPQGEPEPKPLPQPPPPYPYPNPGPTPGPGVGSPSPSSAPTPSGTPGSAPSGFKTPLPADPTKYPDTGFQPNPLTPNPLTPNPLTPKPLGSSPPNPNPTVPNPLVPQPFVPNPKTGDPEPKAPPLIAPPKTDNPKPNDQDDLKDYINKAIGPLAIILAGLTGLVQPEKLREAANAGSCQSFAPGGCNAPIANNAQAAANNSANNNALLAQILAFLQALQAAFMVPILAGVNLINTKLGPVMSGPNGIGGFLARTAEAAKLDKVLNAMNTVLLLHNAAMLSRNLGSTLGDLTSQALATIGIKDGDSPIDVNEILGKQANNFMSTILGAEVWAGTKTSWNKASSIIASATNIMHTMRSMFDSTREILEWTAENTGKIGNALKRFRIVGENAYKWLPERVTVQNRFTQRLDKIREGTDSLDDAASSLSGVLGEVQSIQSEYADYLEQKQKFDANIKDLTPKTREENKPVSDEVFAAKTASIAPAGIENVFRGEGSTTDA